jgi:O-antigen/teichoic acid export membrane protein
MLNKISSLGESLSPGLRKILANIGWLAADRFLQMGLSLFVGLWVARYLRPAQFGTLNYALAFVSLFSALARLGLDSIVVRELVRSPNRKDEILGTTFFLRLAGGIFASLSCIAVIFMIPAQTESERWMVCILSLISIFEASGTIDLWIQSQVLSKYTIWARNGSYLLVCAVRIVLIQMQAPVIAFAGAALLESILFAIGLTILYQRTTGGLMRWNVSKKRAVSLLKDSWPLIISSIVILIYMRTDQIMLGQLATPADVGIYSATVKLSEIWYFAPLAIVGSVFPSIIKTRETDIALYYSRIQKLFSLMTILAYAIALPIAFLSSFIVNLAYGPEYMAAAPVLTVHVWGGVFVVLGVAANSCLIAENLTPFSALVTAVGALINIVLNFMFIPKYGALGASVATVIAQSFASYFAYAFYPKTRKIFAMQTKALTLFGVSKSMFDLKS